MSEFVTRGISVNAIRASVTDTPAMRSIPHAEKLLEEIVRKHPAGRATVPEDVANAIRALVSAETEWMTGNVIGVDGGEHLID